MHPTRRAFITGLAALGCSVAIPARAALASAAPAGAQDLITDLVAANHILVDLGVFDGYGHVSVRSNTRPDHYFMARSVAPEQVTANDILEYDLDSQPVQPTRSTLYLERFIHGEIYKARPDVMAVVHNHSPAVIPFGVSTARLRPIYHMAGFLAGGVPVFDIAKFIKGTDMLVGSPQAGRALAQTLGHHPVALMRGHGMVVVGNNVRQAVFRSYYTQVDAQLQAQAMALGGPVHYLSEEEARRAAQTMGGTINRPWSLWRKKALGE